MEVITQFLLDYGYWGMLLSAFLAGSVFPFSSEAVMLGLLAAGLHSVPLVIYATIGNVGGGLFNYWIGHFGRLDWIEKYLRVKQKDMDRAERFMAGHGAWMGFFAFLPLIGEAITVLLGYMRANLPISIISMTIGKALRYVMLAAGVTGIAGCTRSGAEAPQARTSAEVPTVVVSIEPYRYFTEQIAGDKVKVVTLVPRGASPESYEPTARQMVEIADSRMYLLIGTTPFEQSWTRRIAATVGSPSSSLRLVDTSRGVLPVSDRQGVADPHLWMSTRNAVLIAGNIYKALKEELPADSAYFHRRLLAFTAKARRLDSTIVTTLAQARPRTAASSPLTFLIYHPALTYFAREYGLRQLVLEEEGKEPTASSMAAVIRQARAARVRTFFVQQEVANRNNEVVEQALQLRPTLIQPLGYDWPKEIMLVAKSLR